jgi:HEAT repeat protein
MKHCLARWIAPAVCLVVIFAAVTGCPPSKPTVRDILPPAPPPAVPRSQETALNPALRQSARDVLVAGLAGTDELTRAHCLEAVAEVAETDPHGPDYTPAVLAAFGDSSELVRFSAALTIGRLKIKSAHRLLLADLLDPSFKVRVADHYALHMLGDKRYSHDLEAYSKNPDATVRGATAEVLGLMEEPSATKILLPMRRDTDVRVRQQASEALWRLGNEDGKSDLVALTVSSYADDRGIGLLGLAARKDPDARKFIVGSLTSYWLEVNLVAARALGMLGSDEGYTIAVEAANDPEPRNRLLVALALGAIGRSDSQPILAKLLKDKNAAVRVAAATAILQLQE